jgi:protein TonB
METRKTKKADLSQKRSVFLNLGLVLAMAFVISAFEWKSYGDIGVCSLPLVIDTFDPIINVPSSTHELPKAPKPKPNKIVRPIFVEVLAKDLLEYKKNIVPAIEPQLDGYTAGVELTTEIADEPPFHVIVEKMPEFEGGYSAFMKYLSKKIKYPRQAKNIGIEGKVYVEFIIDESGALTEVHAIKGIGAGCDEEAERVLKNAPKWNPGKQRGIPVKVKMVIPINFQLG